MSVLRLPGQPRTAQLSVYGECDGCHRLCAIARVLGRLDSGEPYGYCQRCADARERPAEDHGRSHLHSMDPNARR